MFSDGLSQNTLTRKYSSSWNWSSSNGREYFLIDLWLGSRTSKLRKCIHANGDTVSSVLRLLQEEFASIFCLCLSHKCWVFIQWESFTCLPHNQTQGKAFNYSCLRYIYQVLKHDIWLYCLSLKFTIYCNFATLQNYCNLSGCEGQKQRGGLAIRHHKLAQKCKMRHTKAPQRETRCFTDNSQVISDHFFFITQCSFASIV